MPLMVEEIDAIDAPVLSVPHQREFPTEERMETMCDPEGLFLIVPIRCS